MTHLEPVHAGEVLQHEFLEPMNITQYALAKAILVPATRIAAIIKGERGITADTALRLSTFFGTSAEFWLNLQAHHDLEKARLEKQAEYTKIQRFVA